MKILAIETSCEHASVALLVDDDLVERRLEGHANHSEHLLPTLRSLLADAGLGLTNLDAVAFGAGPGAFTGLRLACGTVQGIGIGAGLGVVPVPSLAALALQGEGDRIFVATDARMGEVYSAAYRVNGTEVTECRGPMCTPPAQLALPPDGSWFGIGTALQVYAADLPEPLLSRLSGQNAAGVPRAAEVARLAAARYLAGEVVAPEAAVPLYVRDKVALTTAERLARGGRA